jgi:hypothetical protein
VAIAVSSLIWLIWQLARARRFNQFKQQLNGAVKAQIIAAIAEELTASRSALTPNTDAHIQATQYFWTQYPIRILQAALVREIITETWLQNTGNWRNCQHLFFIEHQFKVELADDNIN